MTYKALITTITPVHIGNGVKYNHKLELVYENNYIYIIDPEKIYNLIGDKGIDKWVNAINNGLSIKEFLKNRKFNIEDIALRKCELVNQIKKEKELHEQIHTPFLGPYIPGSSLKGAIKTAILDYITDKNENLNKIKLDDIKQNNKWQFERADKILFGEEPHFKSTRFIKVGDAFFTNSKTKVYFSEALNANITEDGTIWYFNGAISNLYEAIPENSEALFQFSIDENLFKLNEKYKEEKWKNIDINFLKNDLIKIINEAIKKNIKKELEYFNKSSNSNEVVKYISYIEKVNDIANNLKENECILRVGSGSGYNFMTLRWIDKLQFFKPLNKNKNYAELRKAIQKNKKNKDYRNEELWPRTRKISINGIPFGFIKITILSDEEYLKKKEELNSIKNSTKIIEKQDTTIKIEIKTNKEEIKKEIHPPKPYSGKIIQGKTLIPAIVVKSGKTNIVKILVENNEKELPLDRYSSELPEGTYIWVKVTQYTKNEIKRVAYEREYK